MRKNKKLSHILTIIVFFILLTSVRFVWNSFLVIPEHPSANDGVLDLRSFQLPQQQTITLNGEWEFYPNVLLTPEELQTADSTYSLLPEDWITFAQSDTYKTGTFRLRILLNEEDGLRSYGIRIFDLPTATKLFVNGKHLGGSGNPAQHERDYHSQRAPYSVAFIPRNNEIDVLIHVAHGNYPIDKNKINSIKFGYLSALQQESSFSSTVQLIAIVIFFTLAIYAGLIYFVGTRHKVLIYFLLLCLSAIMMILSDYDYSLLAFLSLQYEHSVKISFITYTSISLFLLKFFKHLLPDYANLKFFNWFPYFCGIYGLFIILFPVRYILQYGWILGICLFIPALTITIQLWRALRNNMEDFIYLLLAAVAVTNNIMWAIIGSNSSLEPGFYPVDLIVTLFLFSAFWFKRYFRNAHQAEELSKKLMIEDKRKDEFLANTSHELRNPLHSIINIAQTILETDQDRLNGKSQQDLQLLMSVGMRMSLMINDLLDIKLIKEHRLRINPKPMKLQSITTGVMDMLQYMTAGKQVQLKNNIPLTFPEVVADENRVIQILFNLVHNAIKFTDNGMISVSAMAKDGIATISVADTGIGMEEKIVDTIFHAYEQGANEGEEYRGGLGLGLAICKQLVERQGGQLTVTSKVGEGSVFTFTLPIADEIAKDTQVEPALPEQFAPISVDSVSVIKTDREHFAQEKQRILLVDDDPLNLHVLTNILGSQQYEIEAVTSGELALQKLVHGQWDLVISDVMMPKMSGYELTSRIRERFSVSELPVLLLTARSQPEDVNAGFLAGANDYIVKPIDSIELRARVRSLTELKKSISERLRMEAAWLQAQIEPHFFFNTLNSILVLFDYDIQKAKELHEAFCFYLQASYEFQNSNQLVPIEDEIALVQYYIKIEEVRFGDRLQVNWDVDSSIDIEIPPLMIQTIVENALKHGIFKKASGGTVGISIQSKEEYVVIQISDDGIGMNEADIHNLFTRKGKGDGGIGIINTDRRLKQLYGTGLEIKSKPGAGTTVTFHIPIKR